MYQRNLQTITGKSPVILNKLIFRLPKQIHTFSGNLTYKDSSRLTIAALFILIPILLLSGCDTSGSVGGDIISDDETTGTIEIDIDDITVLNENTFSGRLPNTSVGYLEDPVYGTIQSVALFKPSISRSELGDISSRDEISLRLIFNPLIYGDENDVSSYEIYEAGEIWRGNQLLYNEEVSVNFGQKIAEFEVGTEDTVSVTLSNAWKLKFSEFFNSEAAERDSIYRNSFPGLAIVPAKTNKQIRFIKNLRDDPDDTEELVTSFIVKNPNADNDEELEEDDSENDTVSLSVRDWGASLTRTEQAENENSIIVHNTENVLRFNLNLPVDTLSTKNIVNAQLLLYKNMTPEKNTPGISRPVTNQARIHIFSNEPPSIMSEIFTTNADIINAIDEDEEMFRLNITQFILNEVFGEADERKLYLTIQSVNGILYSTHFFNSSNPEVKPRIVITTVN